MNNNKTNNNNSDYRHTIKERKGGKEVVCNHKFATREVAYKSFAPNEIGLFRKIGSYLSLKEHENWRLASKISSKCIFFKFETCRDCNENVKATPSKRDNPYHLWPKEIIFPLDLDEDKKKNSKITIYGIRHRTLKEKQLYKELGEKASKGEIYLGEEGTPYENASFNNKFGLEEQFLHPIIRVAVNYNENEFTDLISKVSFMAEISQNYFMHQISSKILEENIINIKKSPYTHTFCALLICIKAKRATGVKDLANTADSSEFIQFTKDLGLHMIDEFKKQEPHYEISDLQKSFTEPKKNEYYSINLVKTHAVTNRDHIFLRHIAQEYCKHYKEGKKFSAILGSAHLKGMTQLINKYSGGKIEVETFNYCNEK